MKGIFLMSSERSGSNLLRSILNAHTSISAPPALQLLRLFSPIIHLYGNLKHKSNFEDLVDDVLKMANLKGTKSEWDIEISKDYLFRKIQNPSLISLVYEIYAFYAVNKDKDFFLSKENDLFEYAFNILNDFPDSKFIYLVRDGRDVAVSEKNIKSRKRHIYLLAESWKEEQVKALNAFQNSKSNSIYIIKYEDLLERPEKSLESLFKFLGIPFQKEILNFHENRDATSQAKKSEFWSNISSPILKGNKAKYKRELSKKEIRIFESVCQSELKALGYDLEFRSRLKISTSLEIYYRVYNKILKFVNRNDSRMLKNNFIVNSSFESIRKKRTKSVQAISN